MIHALIRSALARLTDDLPVTDRPLLVLGPVEPPTAPNPAQLVLSPGPFTFNLKVKDQRADQPRPMPVTQRIALDQAQPRGPYAFHYQRLPGHESATLLWDEGTPSERRRTLVEGRGFVIDEARNSLTLEEAVASRGAGVLLLSYVAPGIFGVREFRQTLRLDAYAAVAEDAERWASLAAAVLLTRAEELLARATVEYGDGPVTTTHRFEQLELVEGEPGTSPSLASLHLTFRIAGRLRVARALPGGAGVIEQVVSPGPEPESLVPLNAELA